MFVVHLPRVVRSRNQIRIRGKRPKHNQTNKQMPLIGQIIINERKLRYVENHWWNRWRTSILKKTQELCEHCDCGRWNMFWFSDKDKYKGKGTGGVGTLLTTIQRIRFSNIFFSKIAFLSSLSALLLIHHCFIDFLLFKIIRFGFWIVQH